MGSVGTHSDSKIHFHGTVWIKFAYHIQGFPSALRSGSPVDSQLSYLRVQQQKSRVHKLNDARKCSVVFLEYLLVVIIL